MDHLHKNHIIHRDLAARNILIHSLISPSSSPTNVTNTVRVIPKISDFGLAVVRKKRNVQVPIRWSAPEVLINPRTTEEKSDVWSFGVLLFEICHGCRVAPYVELRSNREVKQAVLNGTHQLIFPNRISPHLVSMAKSCFALSPSLRPSFTQLFESLEEQGNSTSTNETYPLRQDVGGFVEDVQPEDLIYERAEADMDDTNDQNYSKLRETETEKEATLRNVE
eukprot:TRINITY_DN949_c0_g1_i1.p1 TRINITY_DN949_c0_g1~~TRINITY_DN949_c0_g1_i1.p1  ORF type:complete len:236 (-),score=60.41 TRINITY_DN949_c0_g1_i1:390-1058(-)